LAFAAQTPASVKGSAQAAAPVPVPRSDFIATMDTEFRKMDADKDGVLTKKEIEDYGRAMSGIAIDNRRRAVFNALDTDKNGVLTPQEFARLQLPSPPINADPVLAQADLNHDGKITVVEWRTAKLRNFDAMDTDKDGIVSVEEMKAAGLIK
jgi:Ca2+-binding EF-hand superfamily protein